MVQTRVKILRRKEVEERTGLSRTSIYCKYDQGNPKRYDATFPRPIKLNPSAPEGSAVGWLENEIDEWLLAQAAKREVGGNAEKEQRR